MSDKPAEQFIADVFVRSFYRGFDDGTLGEILEVGKLYPKTAETEAMNAALQREIDRRKQEREHE
jgi:hypothetical protein